jgi:hypothetical protein
MLSKSIIDNYTMIFPSIRTGIAQSVFITDWSIRGSNPGGPRFSVPVLTGPPIILYKGYGVSSLAVKRPRSGVIYPLPLQSRGWRKSRTIPPLPLWSFTACSRAKFTFLPAICIIIFPLFPVLLREITLMLQIFINCDWVYTLWQC